MKSDRYRRPTYVERPLGHYHIIERIVEGVMSGELTAQRARILVGTLLCVSLSFTLAAASVPLSVALTSMVL